MSESTRTRVQFATGSHVTRSNQGLFLDDRGGKERERAWVRGCTLYNNHAKSTQGYG